MLQETYGKNNTSNAPEQMSPYIYQLVIKGKQATENTAALMMVTSIASMNMWLFFSVFLVKIS